EPSADREVNRTTNRRNWESEIARNPVSKPSFPAKSKPCRSQKSKPYQAVSDTSRMTLFVGA
ncbi:hypothetical protein, partial [Jiella sonneratiae]